MALAQTMTPILLNPPDQFETERLIIRSPRPGDGLAVFEGQVDTLSDLRAWPASLGWALAEPSIDASEAYCREGHAAYQARTDFPLLMFVKEGNIYLGGSGLHRPDWSVPKFEIGYWCRKQFQGNGLVTEAVVAITQFAFSELGARRVTSLPDVENLPSRRVVERAGYVLEGIMRNERVTPDGQLRSTCLYAITR